MEDKRMHYLLKDCGNLRKERNGPDYGPKDDRSNATDHRHHSDLTYLSGLG